MNPKIQLKEFECNVYPTHCWVVHLGLLCIHCHLGSLCTHWIFTPSLFVKSYRFLLLLRTIKSNFPIILLQSLYASIFNERSSNNETLRRTLLNISTAKYLCTLLMRNLMTIHVRNLHKPNKSHVGDTFNWV